MIAVAAAAPASDKVTRVARCEVGIDIAATREQVWRLVRSADWDAALQPCGGQRVEAVRWTSAQGTTTTFTVTGVEEEATVTWRRSVLPLLLSESLTVLLGDSGPGVRVEVTQAVHGPSAMVVGRLVPDRADDIMRLLAALQRSAADGCAEGMSR
jgi:hypothetical protein